MPIVETTTPFEGFFEDLQCPVCGCEDWSHKVMEGVYCDHCGTKCTLSEPSCDTGVKAKFDSQFTFSVEGAEPIPETEEHGAIATGKWSGSPGRGFYLEWFSPHAEFVKGFEHDWVPAWKRSTGPSYLIDLPASENESTASDRGVGL